MRPSLPILATPLTAGASHGGAHLAPQALHNSGLMANLATLGYAPTWNQIPVATFLPRWQQIHNALARLAPQVEKALHTSGTFLALGGDHSIATGTWSGAANALGPTRPLGLIWVDAHMDAHTPATTLSGDPNGMPLAQLLGHGDSQFTSLSRHGPAILPHNLCLIGTNSFEDGEANLLSRLGVRIYTADDVHRRGMAAVIAEATAHVSHHTHAFGVSLDIDVLNAAEAPGITTPDVHSNRWPALTAAQVQTLLGSTAAHPKFLALECVEFNPQNDRAGRTLTLIHNLLTTALPSHAALPQALTA